MHKQVSSLLSAGSSPGKLAQYTRIIAEKGRNIRSIGGAEWNHQGAVAVLVDDMDDEAFEDLVDTLTGEGFPTTTIWTAEAVLPDDVGALAAACEAIAGGENDQPLNVATILVADTHGGKGLVTFGFESSSDAQLAAERLGEVSVPPHTLTDAWAAHEAWDAENPNQPPPDPANP